MKADPGTFTLAARVLHWLMAVLIVAMLLIGVGMVASVSERHAWLLAIHKPLGIAILILAIVRLAVRVRHPPPPLPADLPALQKPAARASHWLLYFLILAMPLIGWAMLSAGGYPVMLGTSLRLPPIFPTNAVAFAVLRHLHGGALSRPDTPRRRAVQQASRSQKNGAGLDRLHRPARAGRAE